MFNYILSIKSSNADGDDFECTGMSIICPLLLSISIRSLRLDVLEILELRIRDSMMAFSNCRLASSIRSICVCICCSRLIENDFSERYKSINFSNRTSNFGDEDSIRLFSSSSLFSKKLTILSISSCSLCSHSLFSFRIESSNSFNIFDSYEYYSFLYDV
ncbi:hypothetical protein DERF_000383 [Dermatophagoides farinae]|uniref:Uncharacterized protein n=1 Tax=Dermatophagoides farinae TaxID=6954 RepID=A0A922L8L1_DERFA|nr:hypothetical protein DERF_000383 [Dermatophagoides farinae]